MSYMLFEISQLAIYHTPRVSDLFTTRPDWLESLSHDKFVSLMNPFIARRYF